MFIVNKHHEFIGHVWEYYRKYGRDLPWRQEPLHAYNILVSEVMLQQTQVTRVSPKYVAFLQQFPDINTLVNASLADVVRAWSGLGYNRRAKYLHEAAKQLVGTPEPWDLNTLTACKGIGYNTAAAILTYAYNQPIPFIETNIRTAYIHCFFKDAVQITDKQLMPFIEETLDPEHAREWYWALMDYGSFLKTTVGNTARQSKHYSHQSQFQGSKRQVRGQVLRLLGDQPVSFPVIKQYIPDNRLQIVLDELCQEGLVTRQGNSYALAL
jgi:A/G-specific adenine glycosylase